MWPSPSTTTGPPVPLCICAAPSWRHPKAIAFPQGEFPPSRGEGELAAPAGRERTYSRKSLEYIFRQFRRLRRDVNAKRKEKAFKWKINERRSVRICGSLEAYLYFLFAFINAIRNIANSKRHRPRSRLRTFIFLTRLTFLSFLFSQARFIFKLHSLFCHTDNIGR